MTRVYPVTSGPGCHHITDWIPELREPALRLFRQAGLRGLANVEFKRDDRDGQLKLIECNARFPLEEFPMDELPPHCPECNGIVKGDTVMFGEPIPRDALDECVEQTWLCDCMLLVGTSAVVYPAAGFPVDVKDPGVWGRHAELLRRFEVGEVDEAAYVRGVEVFGRGAVHVEPGYGQAA